MSAFPKKSNGVQFKDSILSSFLFSKIITKRLYIEFNQLIFHFFQLNEWRAQNSKSHQAK